MGGESAMNLVPCGPRVRVSYSRFAPGFTPDSRSNSISLHHSRVSRKRWIDRGIALSIIRYHHPSHFL